ncbi:WhiB family transcriptional regulator [Streptomyces sp. NPDC006132]|uniref:WhiB family transcriptional regulator n=1 Tax=Streptomyces sp. NPDC006132 TaxID=3156732 RepID=UPI0033E471AF
MSHDNRLGARPALKLGIPTFVIEAREPLPCRVDPDAFFESDARAGAARSLCAPCLYVEPCGAYGLEHPELRGVWGGLSEKERRVLRRQRLPTAS